MRALPLAAFLSLTLAATPLAAAGAAGAPSAGQDRAVASRAGDLHLVQSFDLPTRDFPVPRRRGGFGMEGPEARPRPSLGAPPPPPKPPPPQTRAQVLDELFTRLARTGDADEAKGIAGAIERIWMRSGSDTADLLMRRAVAALSTEKYGLAERLLDAVVVIAPDWSEGWDKRATARFFDDDYAGAMADIAHVLVLEPRHFGALSGMGFILEKAGLDKEALRVFRKTLEIYPQQKTIHDIVDGLAIKVEGRDI